MRAGKGLGFVLQVRKFAQLTLTHSWSYTRTSLRLRLENLPKHMSCWCLAKRICLLGLVCFGLVCFGLFVFWVDGSGFAKA